MLHRECTWQEFNVAIDKLHKWNYEQIKMSDITTRELRIIQSKLQADISHLSNIRGVSYTYSLTLLCGTEKTLELIEKELSCRESESH